MSKNKAMIENSLYMFLGTCVNILISFFITPIITRLVDPSDYGVWSLFTSYTNVAMAILMLGLDQAFVRFYYSYDSLSYRKYLTKVTSAIPAVLTIILSVVIIPIIYRLKLFHTDDIGPYILLSVNALFMILARIAKLVLRMEQKGREYSVLIIVNKLIFVLWVLGLIHFTTYKDLIVLCSGTTIAQAAVTIVAIYLGRNVWDINANKPEESDIDVRTLIKYGLPFIYTLLATDIFHATDKWAIDAIIGSYEVGIYAAAASIVALCSVFKTTFDLVWSPLAMKHYEADNNEKSFYVKANGCITIVMMIMAAGIIAFKDIIALLLGEKYRIASSIVPFLLFNPVMTTISETTVYGINFKKKTGYHVVITTVACLVNIGLNALLVPIYKSQGAALATAISYIVYFSMRTLMSYRCYPVKFENGKFTICTILLFSISWLNTFCKINIFANIAICILFASFVLILYRTYLSILVRAGKEIVVSKFLIKK